MPPQRITRTAREWRAHAARAITAYVRASGGAVVWPEVEAVLARSNWYARHVVDAPPLQRIDPHHLTFARRGLLAAGHLVAETVLLNDRSVTAYLDGDGLARREQTRIRRLAASKRRLYRRYLGWTGDPRLCGQILERQVHATLDALRGYDVMLEPARPGQISTIRGQPVRGGPLDHAGYLVADPTAATPDLIGFTVEDKNIRSTLYPRAHEVWDLLVKAGDFPTSVPLLVAPHAHYTLLTFFKAIGAVVYTSQYQWFAPEPLITRTDFERVVRDLSFTDARQLQYPDNPSDAIRKFFTTTLRKVPARETEPVIIRSRNRWRAAAGVCARYAELRDDSLGPEQRMALYQQALEDLDEEGIDVTGLLAQHRLAEEDVEHDDPNAWDLDLDLDLEDDG